MLTDKPTTSRVTIASIMGYYLYAIRGTWSPAVKIGYYVADIVESHMTVCRGLRKRYSTPYGSDLDIRVFEVADKPYALLVEKAIHATLKKAGYHINGELFKVECLELFIRRASMLCSKYVTRREWRHQRLKKARVMEKKKAVQDAVQKATIEQQRKLNLTTVNLNQFIADKCSISKEAEVNASKFLQAFNEFSSVPLKQKSLQELMVNKCFKYIPSRRAYRGLCALT